MTLLVAVSAPLVASAVRACTEHYVPASDWALEELQVRAVGTSATPLLGAWSRFGWRHPGPVLFYLLAIPYRLFGGAPLGVQLGVVILNGAAILLTLVLLRLHGRVALSFGALGILLLQFGLYDNFLRNEWNVAVCVFPFVLLLIAAWSSIQGSRLGITVVPLAATFVAQTHVAYVPASLPALGVWLYALRRYRSDAHVLSLARKSLIISGVAWLPVALDAILHNGGNLRRIVEWSQHHSGETVVGLRASLRVVGEVTSLRLPFIRGLRWRAFALDTRSEGWGPCLVLGVMVLLIALSVRFNIRNRDVLSFAGLLLATWAVSCLAIARITGPLYPYLVWSLLALAMLSWFAVVLIAYRLMGSRVTVFRRSSAAILTVCVFAVALVATMRVAQSKVMWMDRRESVIALSNGARTYLHGRSTVVIDQLGFQLAEGGVQEGIMAHLDHSGITVLVSHSAPQLPSDRIDHHIKNHVVMVVAGPESLANPPGDLIARVDPLTPDERQQWVRDYSLAQSILVAAHHEDRAPILTSPEAPILLLTGESELRSVKAELVQLATFNRRGPADFLWVTQRPKATR